ncbi:MAG: hypothetical protein AAGF91_03340 [Actinomycetota bacterium]
MTRVDLPPAELSIGPREAIAALRTLRFGGGDASTLTLDVSPSARAATGPLITAARFGALLFGMAFAVPNAVDGSLAPAGLVAVAVWWTTWRSFRPLVLASPSLGPKVFAVIDAVVLGAGAALSGALVSPFAPAVIVTIAVASFGWGPIVGSFAALAGCSVSVVLAAVFDIESSSGSQQALSVIAASAAVIVVLSLVQTRLREAEQRRRELAAQIESPRRRQSGVALGSDDRSCTMSTGDLMHHLRRTLANVVRSCVHRVAIGEQGGGVGMRVRFASDAPAEGYLAHVMFASEGEVVVTGVSLSAAVALR